MTVLRNGMTAKPVVRGRAISRVLKLDGVRHEGQDWASTTPEIDPFAAGATHVVKGMVSVTVQTRSLASSLLSLRAPRRARYRIHGTSWGHQWKAWHGRAAL